MTHEQMRASYAAQQETVQEMRLCLLITAVFSALLGSLLGYSVARLATTYFPS